MRKQYDTHSFVRLSYDITTIEFYARQAKLDESGTDKLGELLLKPKFDELYFYYKYVDKTAKNVEKFCRHYNKHKQLFQSAIPDFEREGFTTSVVACDSMAK